MRPSPEEFTSGNRLLHDRPNLTNYCFFHCKTYKNKNKNGVLQVHLLDVVERRPSRQVGDDLDDAVVRHAPLPLAGQTARLDTFLNVRFIGFEFRVWFFETGAGACQHQGSHPRSSSFSLYRPSTRYRLLQPAAASGTESGADRPSHWGVVIVLDITVTVVPSIARRF